MEEEGFVKEEVSVEEEGSCSSSSPRVSPEPPRRLLKPPRGSAAPPRGTPGVPPGTLDAPRANHSLEKNQVSLSESLLLAGRCSSGKLPKCTPPS